MILCFRKEELIQKNEWRYKKIYRHFSVDSEQFMWHIPYNDEGET